MTAIWQISLLFFFTKVLYGAPITDPFVKNLTLVGVIHVEGKQTKGQSVAVLREKSTGRTRMLHKGDSLLEADLIVRELYPQEILLMRGDQRFVLRVENQSETTAAIERVETTEVELKVEADSNGIVAVPTPTSKEAVPRFEPKVVMPEDEPVPCEGESCASVP